MFRPDKGTDRGPTRVHRPRHRIHGQEVRHPTQRRRRRGVSGQRGHRDIRRDSNRERSGPDTHGEYILLVTVQAIVLMAACFIRSEPSAS